MVSEGQKEAEKSHGKGRSGFVPLCMLTKRSSMMGTEIFTGYEKGSAPEQRRSRGGNGSLRYNPVSCLLTCTGHHKVMTKSGLSGCKFILCSERI